MKSKTSATPPKGRQRRMATGPEARLARHRAQCHICRHAQREAIEREFVDWVPAREIAGEYKLGSYRAVYRHAHALALFRVRLGNIERAPDNIIERSGEAKITAASVVSVIRLLLELNSSDNRIRLRIMRESAERESEQRTATHRADTGAADRDEEDDACSRSSASASSQLRRALKPPRTATPPEVKLMIAVDPPLPKSERNARSKAPSPQAKESDAKSGPPKPPAPEPGTAGNPMARRR